jgi:hypothetical protein
VYAVLAAWPWSRAVESPLIHITWAVMYLVDRLPMLLGGTSMYSYKQELVYRVAG